MSPEMPAINSVVSLLFGVACHVAQNAIIDAEFYTIAEAIAKAKCSRSTIERAIKSGKLRTGRAGTDYRIEGADLRAWLRSQPQRKQLRASR